RAAVRILRRRLRQKWNWTGVRSVYMWSEILSAGHFLLRAEHQRLRAENQPRLGSRDIQGENRDSHGFRNQLRSGPIWRFVRCIEQYRAELQSHSEEYSRADLSLHAVSQCRCI